MHRSKLRPDALRLSKHVVHKFLFNFCASYSQGGYKRLHEYAKWFGEHGGAWFAIHPLCAHLQREFPANQYFIVRQSHLRRVFDDWSYLNAIESEIGRPELYYAYGIPLYRRVGRVNWAHLSNVLTLGSRRIPLSMYNRLKLDLLGRRIRRGFTIADVISAESKYSLSLLDAAGFRELFLSVNGGDDELAMLRGGRIEHRDHIATIVGTDSYKALDESFRVFQALRERNSGLKLMIIGETRTVPGRLRRAADVVIRGALKRSEVLDCLRRTRFYICTTRVENSCNSAAEGIFLADESYISGIEPNRELLAGERFEEVPMPGASRPLLHVKGAHLRGANLKSWHTVITEMIARARETTRSPN